MMLQKLRARTPRREKHHGFSSLSSRGCSDDCPRSLSVPRPRLRPTFVSISYLRHAHALQRPVNPPILALADNGELGTKKLSLTAYSSSENRACSHSEDSRNRIRPHL